jgi:peptidoglycan/LPS O-acetylase OafA/YrhL
VGVRAAAATLRRRVDATVAATPPERDRYVDFLRALAIGVVVLWHWALSVVYWSGDRWVNPNPLHTVPGGWLLTWVGQVVPVFFLVGGYANAAAWWSARRQGRGVAGFLRRRLRRLLLPVAGFLAVWAGFDILARLLIPGYRTVLETALIVFTPLWFIGAYLLVVVLTPVTAGAHRRARWLTLGGLALAVVAADIGRFGAGITALGWLNTALIWILIHQFGYFYRDGWAPRLGRGQTLAVAVASVAVLAGLTSLPAYPVSMVATVGQERSNIFPTTVVIAVVAVLQFAVAMLLREPVSRWLRRRSVWAPVVAVNSVIMTIFLWHMTALLVVLELLRAIGVRPLSQPTAAWWWQRPFWLLAPGVVLVVLVAVFGRLEAAGRLVRR